MHPVTPHRGVRRAGRSSAVALAALGVFAGTAAVASPASAATVTTPAAFAAAVPTAASSARVFSSLSYLRSTRSAVRAGDAVTLTGRVATVSSAPIRSKGALLQAWNGRTWRTISSKRLSNAGYAVFTSRPGGSVYYRLAFPSQAAAANASYRSSVSARVLVKVVGTQASSRGLAVVATAARQSGKRYRYGAAGPRNFDCSGLTQYVYRQFGLRLPHNANSQKGYGRRVSRAAARPGDLIIFFRGGRGYHAAIYAGGGYMYDAPRAGRTVGKHKIWSSNIVFRRLV